MLSKQFTMATDVCQDHLFFFYGVNEQKIWFDMTFSVAEVIALERVIFVLAFQRLPLKKCIDDFNIVGFGIIGEFGFFEASFEAVGSAEFVFHDLRSCIISVTGSAA